MANSSSDTDQRIGKRIRETRADKGMKQAELAEILGISASYLNLIEHGRRRIGDDLLEKIAGAIDIEKGRLVAIADKLTVEKLLASVRTFEEQPELDHVEDFALRYPGWSRLVARQGERIAALEARVKEVSDRMSFDPALAASLHEVISTATAIRSTASILTGEDRLDDDWLGRFHKNIHKDAIRLAASSEQLISFLEAPDDEDDTISPLQEAEEFLALEQFHFAQLEDGTSKPSDIVDNSGLSDIGRELLAPVLEQYFHDAQDLPMSSFSDRARDLNYNPVALKAEIGCDIALILRRLASLPSREMHPPIGLLQADAAGVLGISKHLSFIGFPRSGACPLWPLFTSLGQPGRAVQGAVSLPGKPETRLTCFAIAEQQAGGIDSAPQIKAWMLMIADPAPNQGPVQPIGPTCRICPRQDCDARRQPAVIRSS